MSDLPRSALGAITPIHPDCAIMHVAFASDALLGHLTPLIPFMQVLLERGHIVTCFHDSHPKNRNKLVECGLEKVSSVTCDMPHPKKFSLADSPVLGGGPLYQCVLDHYADAGDTPDVVVHDFFATGAADAADFLGCPAVCVFPNASVSINPSLTLPSEAGVRDRAWRLFLNFAEAAGARFILGRRNRIRAERDLPPLIEQDLWPCRTMRTLTIGCTGLGLEFSDNAAISSPLFQMVGPSLPSAPQPLSDFPDLEAWIQSQTRPIVYVAFGTMFTHTEETVRVLQRQLESSDVAVLWALPEDQQQWLQKPTPAKHWRIESFAPQLSLLASGRIAAFVSHCGSNSVYEAILSKVPIVACPGKADQPGNAVRVEVAGVGRLARGGLSGVQEAMAKVVTGGSNDEYKRNAERLCEVLATHGGAERAATLIEDAGRLGYDHMIPKTQRTSWLRVAFSALALSASAYVYKRLM